MKRLYEMFYCLLAGIAFLMALFDATYLVKIPYLNLSFRDVYLIYAPTALRHKLRPQDIEEDPSLKGKVYDQRLFFYDHIKGIKVHRTTRDYLQLVDALKESLNVEKREASQQDLGQHAKRLRKTKAILSDLVAASQALVDKNPFLLADKSGDLERIKNLMRRFSGKDSSKASFALFWSEETIHGLSLRERIVWFDKHIRPIMERNYFRWIGEDGLPEDHYHTIDRWFVLFFLLDFLVRWGFAIRRKEYKKWYLFAIRNWSEIFNLYPPPHSGLWRLLRIIPLFLRMRRNKFLPSSGLFPALIHDNAALIAEEISGMVLVNILSQARERLAKKGLRQIALQENKEVLEKIENLLADEADFISREILPEIEPEITELVKFSIRKALANYLDSPLGLGFRLALQGSLKQIEAGLEAALASPEGSAFMNEILRDFIRTLIAKGISGENLKRLEAGLVQILDAVIEPQQKN